MNPGKTQVIEELVLELEDNLRLSEAFLRRADWFLVEQAVTMRSRAVAALRAMLRWHGHSPESVARMQIPREVDSLALWNGERRLLGSYDRALSRLSADDYEVRLIREQRNMVQRAHESLSQHLRLNTAQGAAMVAE